MENEYIKKACAAITDKNKRAQVSAELEAHILDKADYYAELGYDRQAAFDKATADMGDPEEISASLGALHKSHSRLCQALSSLLVLLFALITFFRGRLNYGANYEILVYHSILMDFLSVAFIISLAALLIVSFRQKRKWYAVIAGGILVIHFLLSLFFTGGDTCTILYALHPAAYAAAKIVTSGFSGYVNSIFAYNTVQGGIPQAYYIITSSLIFGVFTLWSAAQFVVLRRGERMQNVRVPSKIIKLTGRISALILAVNLLLMIFGTAAAALNYSENKAQAKTERAQMIETVIKSDLDNVPLDDLDSTYKTIENGKLPEEYYYAESDDAFFMDIYGDKNYSGNYSNSLLVYKETDERTFLNFRVRNSDNWSGDNEKLTADENGFFYPGAKLDDLVEAGVHQKAINAIHYRYKTGDSAEEHIQLWFNGDSQPKYATYLKHDDGRFYLEDYYIMFRDEYDVNE